VIVVCDVKFTTYNEKLHREKVVTLRIPVDKMVRVFHSVS